MSNPKNSLETTLAPSKKKKRPEAFLSNLDIVELDPTTGGIALHIGRFVHFLEEHLTLEVGAAMSKWSVLESVTGAIQACQDMSFFL